MIEIIVDTTSIISMCSKTFGIYDTELVNAYKNFIIQKLNHNVD